MGLHRVGHDWSDLAAAWYFFVNSLSFLCNCPLAFLLSFILFLFTVLRVAFMFYESEVAQPCPTLCDPLDCSLPGFSVHGILQARKLEWVTISFSRGSSWPRDLTQVSRIVGRRFNLWATNSEMIFSCKHNSPLLLGGGIYYLLVMWGFFKWWRFFKKKIYWNIFDLQYCVSFKCTAK